MNQSLRRTVAALGASGLLLAVGSATAFAHIDPDPVAVQAGTGTTVAFGVEHGCASSPTTALDIKIPDGISDAKPVDKPGWTSAVDGGIVRFSGGKLDAETADTFSITFTAPTAPGTILFPIVQKCVVGETDWLDVATDGQPEPEHPAPALLVTSEPPTAAELTPKPDSPDTTVAVTSATTSRSKGGDSHTGLTVGLAIAGVVVIGAAAAVWATKRRQARQRPI